MGSRPRTRPWLQVVVFGLALLLSVGVAAAGAEEPTVAEYPASNFEPGPGWPEGWTPPPVPTGISERMRQEVERVLREYPHLYSDYDWHVLEPPPRWTPEYPYYWAEDWAGCGKTMHVFWYPEPDTALITRVMGRSYVTSRVFREKCLFEPIKSISEVRTLTKEEQEAEARGMEYEYWMDKSHPGLGRDFGYRDEGNPNKIYVFLNAGGASRHFDEPAYLDTSVNRVRVPIRFVSEMMGAEVSWDEASRQVTIHFPAVTREVMKAIPAPGYDYPALFNPEAYFPDGKRFLLEKRPVSTPERTIILTIGQPTALVDGQEVALDAPPVIKGVRTMVPVRFIAEQMGAKVYWVGDKPIFRRDDGRLTGTYQVHIFTPFYPLYEYPSWYMENRAVKF